MILTPYRGQLATGDGEILPRLPIGRDRDEFFKRVRQSLEVIFQRLSEAPERPISSHQVLRAIDRGWSELSRIFGWGWSNARLRSAKPHHHTSRTSVHRQFPRRSRGTWWTAEFTPNV